MSININSESYCRKVYLDYHCYGNTLGTTSTEMGEIVEAWKDRLPSWQNTVTSDENEYEFDDSEFENSKAAGKQAGIEATDGYDGKKHGGGIAAGCVMSAGSAVGAGFAAVGSEAVGKLAGEKATKIVGEKAAEKAGGEVTKKAGAKLSAYVAATLAIINATRYLAAKPNKEGKEACDAMQNEMLNAQGAATDAQSEMEAMGEELITLSDEANEYNEEANEQIEEQKSEYDMYMQSIEALKAKVESGEPLTEDEKALYSELVKLASESGVTIQETTEETGETVEDIYSDMGSYQEGYDYAAETIGEIEGLTDYAESFDKTTQTMCYVEGASQTLNAASGASAAARLFAGPWWNWIIAGLSLGASAASGVGAAEQFKWAGEVGTEIDMRESTQDLNAETSDMYSQEIDNYDGWMTGVEDLELEIPDEIEPPEETALPESTTTGTEEPEVKTSTGFGVATETEDTKKKEEEK